MPNELHLQLVDEDFITEPPICADCGGYHELEDCPDRHVSELEFCDAQVDYD